MLADLYETCDWQDVTEVLEAAQTVTQQRLLAQESEVRLALTETREAREAKEMEIAQLKEAREAEPEQHEAVRATRARLRAAGIPCQPFYEAVEFKKEVSPETCERLESALTEAGLLQALILADDAADAQLTAEDYGAVLRAGEPVLMGQSLCDYLEPTPDEAAGVTKERIAAVLGGIQVALAAGAYPAADGGVTCIDIEAGGYAQGCVSGHAPHAEGARYIGRQAREALRRRQREERQQAEIAKIAAARAAVLEARRAFPAETACRTQYEAARAKEAFITQQAQRVEEKDAQQKERQLALRESIAALRELRADDALAAEDAAYEAAERQLEEYQQELDVMFRKARRAWRRATSGSARASRRSMSCSQRSMRRPSSSASRPSPRGSMPCRRNCGRPCARRRRRAGGSVSSRRSQSASRARARNAASSRQRRKSSSRRSASMRSCRQRNSRLRASRRSQRRRKAAMRPRLPSGSPA